MRNTDYYDGEEILSIVGSMSHVYKRGKGVTQYCQQQSLSIKGNMIESAEGLFD